MRDNVTPMTSGEVVPPALERAVALLREPPALDRAWRADLLQTAAEQAAEAIPTRRRRGLFLTTPMAIAAGILCAVAGAGAALLTTHGARSVMPIAALPSSPSDPSLLPVRFSVVAPSAGRVSIVGDFNQWNPASLPMHRSADGRTWQVEVRLPLGRYSYAYLIDGKIAPDPAAPREAGDDFGAPNSVLMVHGS